MRRLEGCGARRRLGRLADARKTRSPGNPVAASPSAWRSDFGFLIVPPHYCPVRISKRQGGRMGRRPVKKQPSTPAVLAKSENWRGADQPRGERLTSFPTKPCFILLEAFVKDCRRTAICSPVNRQTPRYYASKATIHLPMRCLLFIMMFVKYFIMRTVRVPFARTVNGV